jgi:hypothetical protein
MKAWIKVGLGLIVGALCWNIGNAATLVVNCTIGPLQTELNNDLACGKFNLAGQSVSSIAIDLGGQITGTLSLTNNAATAQTARATTSTEFNVTSIAGMGPGNAPDSGFNWSNPVFSASFTTGLVNLAAGQTQTFSGLSGSGTGALGLDTTQIAPYVGPGFFDIHVTTLTGLTASGGGGQLGVGQVTNAEIQAVVTYTYSPVPEPATMSLIAVGLLGLGALQLRAHRRS